MARGFTTLVDDKKARPRIDFALEQATVHWFPLHAEAELRARAVLTPVAGGEGVSAEIALKGSCMGLVGRDAWQTAFVTALADHAADAIGGSLSTKAP